MKLRRNKKDGTPRRRQTGNENDSKPRQLEYPGRNLFRRNQTLVGSLSSSVSSAGEMAGALRSPRAHVHHLNAHRRRLSSILFVVMLCAGFLTWLLYEFTAGISVTPTSGGLAINEERYKQAINNYLIAHPNERLRSLINEKALSEYVATKTSEVASVHVGGPVGLATTQFDIVLRRPVAGWSINGDQYYVDKDGVSFQVNYFGKPAVKIVDNSGVPQTAGSTVASSRFLRFVGRAVELSRNMGMVIDQAVIPANTTRQIELRIAGRKYPVKLSLDRPVGEQIEDMQRAVIYFDEKKQSPNYVDVRVSGRAFYR